MMDWFPVVFIVFKVLVLGTGMFLAVKWHYEKGKNDKAKRVASRVVAEAVAIFVLFLLSLLFLTYILGDKLGLDLTFS